MIVKPLNQYPQEPLSEESSQILISLLLMERSADPEAPETAGSIIEADQMCRLVVKRAEHHGLKLTPFAAMLIAHLSEGVPGRAVQLLHALAANSTPDQEVSVHDFCMIFPMGIPSDDGFSAAWDAQKDTSGLNLLDNSTTWNRNQ